MLCGVGDLIRKTNEPEVLLNSFHCLARSLLLSQEAGRSRRVDYAPESRENLCDRKLVPIGIEACHRVFHKELFEAWQPALSGSALDNKVRSNAQKN